MSSITAKRQHTRLYVYNLYIGSKVCFVVGEVIIDWLGKHNVYSDPFSLSLFVCCACCCARAVWWCADRKAQRFLCACGSLSDPEIRPGKEAINYRFLILSFSGKWRSHFLDGLWQRPFLCAACANMTRKPPPEKTRIAERASDTRQRRRFRRLRETLRVRYSLKQAGYLSAGSLKLSPPPATGFTL